MKTRFIVVVACIMVGMSVQAQSLWDISKPDHRFTFGMRAGVNFASTDMDYATSTRTGFHGGLTADWNIVKSFSVSTGVLYVNKGFKSDFGKGEAAYLELPLLASWRIETVTGVRFFFNVGPYFAWGVGGTVKYAPYDETFAYNYHQDTFGQKGFFKHFDAGLSAGAYIVLGHVLAGLSYEYGFTDIAKVYGKFHNRNACMTIGYNF